VTTSNQTTGNYWTKPRLVQTGLILDGIARTADGILKSFGQERAMREHSERKVAEALERERTAQAALEVRSDSLRVHGIHYM